MKKTMRNFISMLIVLAMIACAAPAAFAAEADGWTSLTEHYTVVDGKVVSSGAAEDILNAATPNFCLSNQYIASGDYLISVKMQGTMGSPNTKHVQEGIIPWYLDADNYLYVYVQWSPNDRTDQVHQMHIAGKISGQFIGYHDIWTDGVVAPQNTELTLYVQKTTTDGIVKIACLLKDAAGNELRYGDRTLNAEQSAALAQEGKMGVFAFNDTVTFSEFTSDAPVNSAQPEQPDDPQQPAEPVINRWASLTEHYTIQDDGSVVANGVCEGILDKTNFCLNNSYIASGDYSVSVKMQGTMSFPNTTHVQQGIIPWYQDADNYLFVYVQWSDNDRRDQMHQLHISGKVNGEHLGWGDCWTDGVTVSNDTELTLTVTKETVDGCVKLSYSLTRDGAEVTRSQSKTFDAKYTEKLSEEGQMGVYAYGNGVHVTFREFASTAPVAELPCAHANTEVKDAKDADCENGGYTGDTYCTDCGEKLEEGQSIAAKGHSYAEGKCTACGAADPDYVAPCQHTNTELKNAAAATCEGKGYTGDTVCADCGETVKAGEEIAALGHSYGEDGACTVCSTPKTGDMTVFVVAALVLSAAAMVVLTKKNRLF